MEIKIRADPVIVKFFKEHSDHLKKVGVTITAPSENILILSSNKFLKATPKETETIVNVTPDEDLLKTFESLTPFAEGLSDWSAKKGYYNARIIIHHTLSGPYTTECPFCGHTQEYYTKVLPSVYPSHCTNCGAKVLAEVGDHTDICETIINLYPLTEYPEIITSENEIRTKDGLYIARIVEKDESIERMHTWLIFIKNK